jgi:chemosensory pili system protein ChpB (putative protein-glutamate methylesterase)
MPRNKAAAKVGIIADDILQQHLLKSALMHFGFNVVLTIDPERLNDNLKIVAEIDAWVVDIVDEDGEQFERLDELFVGDVPILFGMGKAPKRTCETYPRWEKRLFSKMKELLADHSLVIADESSINELDKLDVKAPLPLPVMFQGLELGKPAQHIWVLGASLGGPDAVKEFLDALPKGLPVGFIYAQHIDARFQNALVQTLGRHAGINMVGYEEGRQIKTGEVMLAPVEREFKFDFDGRTISKSTPWSGPYGPSVDQVMINVAEHFAERARYILFSGMGNDGAEAITTISQNPTTIWAQNSESCANSSMPDNAVATGHVSYIGTPRQLASQLVNYLQTQWNV